MANFDLNKFYKKSSDIKSPADTRILLNKAETDKEKYGDILLDLQFNEIKQRPINAKQSTKDLKRTVNEESILNSLRNIFNTYQCSRLLNPQMEFQLKQYLFEPLNSIKGWFIGYDICTKFVQYQPRVSIQNVNITANVPNNCYIIKLRVRIPQLNKDVSINSILKQDGFVILG